MRTSAVTLGTNTDVVLFMRLYSLQETWWSLLSSVSFPLEQFPPLNCPWTSCQKGATQTWWTRMDNRRTDNFESIREWAWMQCIVGCCSKVQCKTVLGEQWLPREFGQLYCPNLGTIWSASSNSTAHFKLHTTHLTLHTSNCILHTAYFTLHNSHCTLFNAQCTLHTVTAHYIVKTEHCKPLTVYCTLPSDNRKLHTTHYTLHYAHYKLHTAHYILDINDFPLHTTDCPLHTVHTVHTAYC